MSDMTTPTPTVIEEARKMAETELRKIRGFAVRLPNDNHHLIRAFIAAIELGERRGNETGFRAGWATGMDAVFSSDASIPMTAHEAWADFKRRDHRSKPA